VSQRASKSSAVASGTPRIKKSFISDNCREKALVRDVEFRTPVCMGGLIPGVRRAYASFSRYFNGLTNWRMKFPA
jgi:hypothetical protein